MATIQDLFDLLWKDYVQLNPIAGEIHRYLEELSQEKIINDHIALRTFRHPKVGLDVLARPFLERGYVQGGEYHFETKKLYAQHFEPEHPDLPKVFISELKLEEFSSDFQKPLLRMIDEIPENLPEQWNFSASGRHWKVTYEEYEKLASVSEYGAWMSAFGFRANHFTVNVNRLSSFSEVQELNEFLKEKGVLLNRSGGEVKGTRDDLLEQSSTLANEIEIDFEDGKFLIPACYYEFAKRYPDAQGRLYQGFVAQSADKIFESTDRQR